MSKVQKTIRVCDFDPNKITLGVPHPKSKSCTIYHKGEKLFVQLPPTTVPFDITTYKSDYGRDDKVYIDLSLDGHDNEPDMIATYEKFQKLEQFVFTKGLENAASWLNFKKG